MSNRESGKNADTTAYPFSWVYAAVVGVAFIALAAWSWFKWTDPIIDMGRELYVPWQITQGKVLYRDISSLYGPLSSQVNALLFRLFGASLTTLVFCNLALLAGVTVVMYRLFRTIGDRITATVVCLVFLCLFSFSQYAPISNYNFVTPYSHEAVHGTVLAIVVLYLLHRFAMTGRSWMAGIAGCCFGAVWLTKPECAVAATGGVITWTLLYGAYEPHRKVPRAHLLLLLLAGGICIPALFFAVFALRGNLHEAFMAVGGMWLPLVRKGMTESVFYASVSGFGDPVTNLRMLLVATTRIGAVVGAFWIAGTLLQRLRGVPRLVPELIGVCTFCVLFSAGRYVGWEDLARPLPLLVLVSIPVFVAMAGNTNKHRLPSAHLATAAAWSVFSLLLLVKMLLNVRVYHYGFYLALPSTLLLVWVSVYVIPVLLSRWPLQARLWRYMAIAVIAAGVVYHLQWSDRFYRLKTASLGEGTDVFMTYPGRVLPLIAAEKEAVAAIGSLTAPDDAMVVIPEGAMINYLCRRRNPTPYLNFLPPEMRYYGEDTMIASLEKTRPEWIVLVRRNVREFGEEPFGVSERYGKRMLDWINDHYTTAKLIGTDPVVKNGTGIKILRRR